MNRPPKDSFIVIVDDKPENLSVLRQMLKEQGYNVRAAINGDIAIKAIKANPPDLVLLDIMMPDMDGYEVCDRLKANEQTSHIPIIFISALDELADKVRAFAHGGVDYITKPFQTEEVLARVDTHITLHHLRHRLEEKNAILQKALDEIKTLKGLIPICSSCKQIRDDKGYWTQVEEYISSHSEAKFSHSICPSCIKALYPEFYDKVAKEKNVD